MPVEVTPEFTSSTGQAPVAPLGSESAVPRSSEQPLMFWTRKTEPLNVLSWKFRNSCRNAATLTMKWRWVSLTPSS
jgi:hypothetical protein